MNHPIPTTSSEITEQIKALVTRNTVQKCKLCIFVKGKDYQNLYKLPVLFKGP